MSVTTDLSDDTRRWLTTHRFTILRTEGIMGHFSASLYRIHALSDDGCEHRLIYKRCADGRASEIQWLTRMLPRIRDFCPPILAIIDTVKEQGILMQDCGPSLKSTFDASSNSRRLVLLDAATKRLVALHVRFADQTSPSSDSFIANIYPIDSAATWSRQSLNALSCCHEENLLQGVDPRDIESLRSMAEKFYANYATFLSVEATLTHGDTHLGNFVGQDTALVLIDWEFAHIAPPQRDIAILIQDMMDEELQQYAYQAYVSELRKHDWPVDTPTFDICFQACLFDNTLMMLGWDVQKYRDGFLTSHALSHIATKKLGWLRRAFGRLF